MAIIKTVRRYHDISAGHRVCGHEGKCRGLHGHNDRVHFECSAPDLDDIGRVIDFSVMKEKLCMWLEDSWDHKMILWDQDPIIGSFRFQIHGQSQETSEELEAGLNSIITVPFNPTAENMAAYLLEVIGPQQLAGTGVTLVAVHISETMKCSATARLGG